MNGQEQPSQSAANAVMRVLVGKPLKYTVRVHKADGSVIEFQANIEPKLHFDSELRAVVLAAGKYNDSPIMEWEKGMVVQMEENNPE